MKQLSPEAKIFLRAADYVREHGWCQGLWVGENGSVCFVGALMKTDLTDFWHERQCEEACMRILGNTPIHLNDKVWTSPQDCIDALTKCALEYDRCTASNPSLI